MSNIKDIDDFLHSVDDPEAEFAQLLDGATLLTSTAPQGKTPMLHNFISFKLLGELGEGLIAFWSMVNRKIYITSLKDLTLDKLDQIGGEEVMTQVCRKPEDGKISFRVLKRQIITEAAKTQLGNPDYLGQGIHQLYDGNLLIVNGGEAWIWDGKKGTRHESPLV